MALTAYSTNSQTVNTGSPVIFNNTITSNSYTTTHSDGSASIKLNKAGWYLVGFTATATTVATGGGTLQFNLYSNGTKVNGFEASGSVPASTSVTNLSQSQFLVRVNPNCCAITNNVPVSLVVQNDGGNATVSNANITVTKLC